VLYNTEIECKKTCSERKSNTWGKKRGEMKPRMPEPEEKQKNGSSKQYGPDVNNYGYRKK